ncbi:helix-turn-helix domain-containing protein [Amycolatopsis sp. NPDC058278]|uniref:helix-turn-helix domain-containing protein n=1 Tax=Amycolatopsis sp. NPDC058278 TaxID=3346417 RepID=UPI0036DA917F
MSPSQGREELARSLSELKARSKLSYEALARRCHLSRSSVHRYCTAALVPPEFGVLESIATVCGADRAELARLFRCWARAVDERPGSQPAPAVPPPAPGSTSASPARARTTARHRLTVPTLVFVLLGTLVLSAASTSTTTSSPGEAPLAVLSAPMWAQTATDLDPGLFGATINSSTGAMPTFGLDSVRFWDSHTRWANIEPRRGIFDWSVLDRLVAGAGAAGLRSVFSFGGTPEWASPGGAPTLYDDGSKASPPTDLRDWDGFVGEVAGRYRGHIGAYELWAVVNDAHFYTGSVETLAAMTRRAHDIIRAADPGATIVCPSMGGLERPEAQQFLTRFAALGGYRYCDVAGVKLTQPDAAAPPETMLPLVAGIDNTFQRAGLHPPVWDTGTRYDISLQRPLDPATAADHAVRFYLVALFAHYRRAFFYNWGGTKIPIILQPDGGAPTPAALAVEQLRRWLRGARIHSCGQGTMARLPAAVWECRFDDGHDPFVIRWTAAGRASMSADPGSYAEDRLDGTEKSLAAGDPVDVTTSPVRINLRTGA